jgi:hypothetical protein
MQRDIQEPLFLVSLIILKFCRLYISSSTCKCHLMKLAQDRGYQAELLKYSTVQV